MQPHSRRRDRRTPANVTAAPAGPIRPPIEQAVSISPLAAVHTLGNALTNISLGAVAVSFTHTIKALEPMFSGARGLQAGRCLEVGGRRGWLGLQPLCAVQQRPSLVSSI